MGKQLAGRAHKCILGYVGLASEGLLCRDGGMFIAEAGLMLEMYFIEDIDLKLVDFQFLQFSCEIRYPVHLKHVK